MAKTTSRKQTGRPRGSKDKVKRKTRTKKRVPVARMTKATYATFKAICEEVQNERGVDMYQALVRGIRSGPAFADKFIKLVRDSTDGPPQQGMNLSAQFKEDEVAHAGRELQRKMASLFTAVLGVKE